MMKRNISILLAFVICVTPLLSACHGSVGMAGFEVPESFDMSKNYEITFWAKNDTNKLQTIFTKRLSPIFRRFTLISR